MLSGGIESDQRHELGLLREYGVDTFYNEIVSSLVYYH